MSRAFVKEPDGTEPIEVTERQISPERNLVTEKGLQLIRKEIDKLRLQADSVEVKADKMQSAQIPGICATGYIGTLRQK